MGAKVKAFDPASMHEAKKLLANVSFCTGIYECIDGADAVVLVTEWDEFRALDLDRVKSLMKSPVMVDLRNVYRPQQMREKGFEYSSIGRP
jgi:UDPglucose 6-dehydrogenase